MLVINDRQATPPTIGWNFQVHQLPGKDVTAGDYGELLTRVAARLTSNGIAVPENLEDVVNAQICDRVCGGKKCNYCRETDPAKKKSNPEANLRKQGIKVKCCGGGKVR